MAEFLSKKPALGRGVMSSGDWRFDKCELQCSGLFRSTEASLMLMMMAVITRSAFVREESINLHIHIDTHTQSHCGNVIVLQFIEALTHIQLLHNDNPVCVFVFNLT